MGSVQKGMRKRHRSYAMKMEQKIWQLTLKALTPSIFGKSLECYRNG